MTTPHRTARSAAFAALAAALVTLACAGGRGSGAGLDRVAFLEAVTARALDFDAVVERLADADVVLLGELHDSGPGHAAQLALTRALFERRGGGTLALEQFERDVQDVVDAWLAGRIDREGLEAARPWSNHDEHYHAALELAKELGVPVVAANAPRVLASRVGKLGAPGFGASAFAPRWWTLDEPAYRERFAEAMGGSATHGHGGPSMDAATIERFFAAQVARDESMAEAIADHVRRNGERALPVVLWCGRFHSDYGHGTASRLRARRPDLELAILTMERRDQAADAAREEPPPGDVVIAVP